MGVDVATDAIDDARKNAQRNKIENAAYVAGPAEDLIPQMIGQATHEEIVAVIGQSGIQLHYLGMWEFLHLLSQLKLSAKLTSQPKCPRQQNIS